MGQRPQGRREPKKRMTGRERAMPANYGRQIRRVPVTASARRLVHRRALSLRVAPQLRKPLNRRCLHGARDRVRFPMSAPARYQRRIVHLAQTTKQASVPIVPQRRPAAFAWALVAARESGFDPVVRAEGTTATGLYQFTEDTWLRALKIFGVRHGLTELAQQITIDEYGGVSVRAGARAKLLQLRNDPKLSALMAAELARDNKARLERLLGRDVSPAETYLAHFLGVGQAARIIAAAHSKPHVSGARLLPAAARSNPAVFAPAGHAASAGAIVGKIEAYFSREVSPSARI